MEDNNEKIYFDLVKKPLKSERREKRRKILGIIAIIALCLLLFVTGLGIGLFIPRKRIYNYEFSNVLEQVEYIFTNRYLYNQNDEEFAQYLEDKALKGMTTFDDDPFTFYMSLAELEEFYSGINQSFVGLGIQYQKVNDVCIVTKVFFDSPAEKAGLQEGDLILEIDDISVKDKTTDEIKEMAMGEIGTEVKVKVERNARPLILTVVRGTVDYTVLCDKMDDYLYMAVESFGESTGKEMANYLDKYSDVKKIIIDIRNNGGGFQTSVAEVCGLFIGNDQVYLQQEDNKGKRFADVTKCDKTYDFDKIVILTNKSTASAAEVFAICMREKCPNTTIVGTVTYGKGVIQNTVSLINGGALKFTDYYWYSPNGVSIHKTGLEPDIMVENDEVFTSLYVEMKDDETFAREDVSDAIELCEKCLKFMDFDVKHTNGYFDESLETIINDIKTKNGFKANGVLDRQTYENILSSAIYLMSNDETKDLQLQKAKELMR